VLRGLLRPRWILLHVGIAVLVALMVNFALWQAQRLDERRAFNATVSVRSQEPVVPLADLAGTAAGAPSSVEWRRASVTGTYDAAGTVTIVNRSSNGAAGYDQLVPLRTDGLGIVLVNRGFVPLATAPDSPVPSAPVTAVGYLRATQTRGTLGAVDSTDPATVEFQRIDVPLISRKFGGTVFPLYLQLVAETPPTGADWPAPVAFPELSEGSHQSYVFQWSFFSLVAVAGWVVVVRRKWRAGAPVSGSPGRTSA
jgi:cytochrome oxidase assembly protein ShyY1